MVPPVLSTNSHSSNPIAAPPPSAKPGAAVARTPGKPQAPGMDRI